MNDVNSDLRLFVEGEILPRYAAFDGAHRRDHAEKVIAESLALARNYSVDVDMVYAIAAYHDLGLVEGRERHHLVSGCIVRGDHRLRRWFDAEQIETMAQAVEDHRASSSQPPRSLYGMIVAEADRDIVPLQIVRRTVQYSLSHYPELDRDGHWHRCLDHLHEKYAEGGYMRLWLPESANAEGLRRLRALIADEIALRSTFDELFEGEKNRNDLCFFKHNAVAKL